MAKYQVVKALVLQHKQTGKVISFFSALPYGTSDDWETIETGWTVYNPNTNERGVGLPPWKTEAEAQAYADTHHAPSIGFGD